jgi:RNA polymerase sigma-70 factor, ECF subfamily
LVHRRGSGASNIAAQLFPDTPEILAGSGALPRVEAVVHDLFQRQLLEHIPRLRAFALSLTHNVEEADDLVQEVLLRAWRARESFELGTNLHAWLFRILRNAFYNDAVIKRRAVQDVDGAFAAKLQAVPNQEWRVRWSEMLEALQQLKPHAREALLMIAAAGLSYEDAAEICGCPVGTIKSRVKRARVELAQRIDFELPREPTATTQRRCA